MLSVPHLWALWCLDMMSGHDIDSMSEDGLSPLTHIAHLTHEDYNFIVLKHILLILVAFFTSLDPSIPPGLFDFDTLIEDIKGRNLLFTSPSELMRISSIFIALLKEFWKIVPHLFDFLWYVYFDFIGQVQKCRKQIYFCNIVMVGHFTFGLC